MAAVRSELEYALRWTRKHAGALSLLFFGVLLPLWGLAALIGEVHERAVFPFDDPLLNLLHAHATPRLDIFFEWMSRLGFTWGVIPIDVVVLVWLALRRRYRDSLFFGLAVIGSIVLNVAAKNYFARARPTLWLSLTPQSTYSFPSGHAMGSATLGAALILLFWRTRWRWLVIPMTVPFVLLVGVSRVYLGLHYPSDILAGWTAAIAWVVGTYQLVGRTAPAPPVAVAGADTVKGRTDR